MCVLLGFCGVSPTHVHEVCTIAGLQEAQASNIFISRIQIQKIMMEQPMRPDGLVETVTCFGCGEGLLAPGIIALTGERNGESFLIRMEGLKCDRCGYQTIDSKQSSEFTRLISDAYRAKHGLLTGPEIRECRAQLGMTQHQFSDYLGTGVARREAVGIWTDPG